MSNLPPETGQEQEKRVNAAAATPNQPLKEKKSWQPFLAALKGGKDRLLEKVSNESLAQSRSNQSLPRPNGGALILHATPTMTLDPPFMEQSMGACSAESTPGLTTMSTPSTTHWLSPLPLPMPSTARTRDRYSPFSATTFSPQTPDYLIKSPGTIMRGMGIQHGLQQPQERSQQPLHGGTQMPTADSHNILSLTPGISPNTPLYHHDSMASNRRLQPSLFMSQAGLGVQQPAPIHHTARKSKSLQDLSSSTSQRQVTVDEQGRDVRGPLHGLGLHVGWAEDTVDYKGKQKATSLADETEWESKLHHQASQLLKLKAAQDESPPAPVSLNSSLGRRPAVGILTSSGLSPTESQSPMIYRSPSATTVGEPSKSNVKPHAVEHHVDEDTIIGSPAAPIYHSPAFARTANRGHRDSQAMINMHSRELQPAKLFFLLGFLLGPCKSSWNAVTLFLPLLKMYL